jgi:hypothetical protein
MKSKHIAIICAIFTVIAIGGIFGKEFINYEAKAKQEKRLVAMPRLNVFFIGNSYTFFNDLPLMVSHIAASYKENPINIRVGMYAHGGWSLHKLWDGRTGHDTALLKQKWDIVVLQETSMETLLPEWRYGMQEYMIKWNKLIRSLGAQPYVYETWARKPGSYWYTTFDGHDILVSPEYMQKTVDYYTNMLAKYIHAPVVPVGDYFAYCRDLPGAPELYFHDGTHPSLAGDYLVALLFARALTHHRAEDATYIPPGLSKADAAFIVKCASYGEP